MKYFSVIVIFYFVGFTGIFAQTGYKNFTFGMNVDQVKRLAPDIVIPRRHGGGDVTHKDAILVYLYNSEIGFVCDSTKPPFSDYAELFWVRTFSLYYSEKEDIDFWFLDNKLYAIEVHFAEDVISELKKRYGDKRMITINDRYENYFDTVTWIDGNRFISYLKYYGDQGCTVEYCDMEYLNPVLQKTMEKYRHSRSRID
jgi:hypothetical protein